MLSTLAKLSAGPCPVGQLARRTHATHPRRMSMRMLFVAGAVLLLAVAYFKSPSSTGKGPYHADLARTPGVVNPDVTQANIAATICTHGWTRTIRPPTDYTNALKLRQMREYGVAGAPGAYP